MYKSRIRKGSTRRVYVNVAKWAIYFSMRFSELSRLIETEEMTEIRIVILFHAFFSPDNCTTRTETTVVIMKYLDDELIAFVITHHGAKATHVLCLHEKPQDFIVEPIVKKIMHVDFFRYIVTPSSGYGCGKDSRFNSTFNSSVRSMYSFRYRERIILRLEYCSIKFI